MRSEDEVKLTLLPRIGTFFYVSFDTFDDEGDKTKTRRQLKLEEAHPFKIVARDTATDRLYVYNSLSEFEYATSCTVPDYLLATATEGLEDLQVGQTFEYDGRRYLLLGAEPARQVGYDIAAVNNSNSGDRAMWPNMDPLHFSLIVKRNLKLQ